MHLNLTFLFIFLRYFLFISLAVDRSQFRTCDDSSFCKRHRHYAPTQSPYEVVADSVKIQDNSLNILLENTLNKRQLILKLSSFGDSRIGITIDEANPIKQRFRVTDSFTKLPTKRGFRDNKSDKSTSSVTTLDGHQVVVQHQPFRLDVFDKNDLVLTLNSQGLLKYEHYRARTEKPTDAPSAAGVFRRFILRPFEKVFGWFRSSTSSSSTRKSLQNDKSTNDDDGSSHDKVETHAADDDDGAGHSSTESPVADQPPSGDSGADNETEEAGMWDEHWRSHHDTKPFGACSIGLDVSFIGFKHVYGLPEHADSFVLKSTSHTDPYRLYNLDVAEYELNNPMALYGAIPYMIGHSQARTVGLLWLNAAETWIDIKNSVADKSMFRSLMDRFKSEPEVPQIDTHWMSESGLIDIYLFFGPKPVDVFRQYTDFFGVTNVPPYFSIAYHQCRWNYNDVDDVKQVDANFDVHDIPYDVLWLDIEHTDGKKYFTWDPNKFSDPKSMIDNLASKGRKLVTIVDPHIKRDDNYKIYKDAKELNYFVKNKDGNDYEGWCWPGSSMYLDFFNPVVRDWWSSKYAFDEYEGSSENLFIWNDMNEPSVFNGPEITMYKDCKHFGGWEHRDVHNMYGFYNHMATFNGLLKRTDGVKRPFILTRSFFVGSQKYASVWTGDNTADWSHLQIAFPMLLSLSIGGIPFVGADVGGFFKNPEEELLVRWYQAGAFNPFYRAHAHLDTRRREPWLFSNESKLLIREAIRRRYIMLPYWYTVFYEHMITGLPILRPLWLEFPNDIFAFDAEKEAMIGRAILVRPVVDKGASSASVYLPGDKVKWYDWDTFKGHLGPGAMSVDTPLNKIPVYIRGGTIVPLKMRVRRAASLSTHDPITLYVALDTAGTFANGTLYVDDGETFDYSKGIYCYRLFEYTGDDATGVMIGKKISGDDCKTDVWLEKIVILGFHFRPKDVLFYTTPDNPVSLNHAYDSNTRSLVIRKPGANIGIDFRMEIFS